LRCCWRVRCVVLPVIKPERSSLLPYTTLFRSAGAPALLRARRWPGAQRAPRWAPVRRWPGAQRAARQAPVRCWPAAGSTLQEGRSEEHTSELQSRENLVCRLLLEKKKRVEVGR